MFKYNIILFGILLIGSLLPVYSVCFIDEINNQCTANVGVGTNTNIQDKLIPNSLEKMTNPNSSYESRTPLGQPKFPKNINIEQGRKENTQPYDANCQFGNCFSRTLGGQPDN